MRSIQEALKSLEDANFLAVERGGVGATNRYLVNASLLNWALSPSGQRPSGDDGGWRGLFDSPDGNFAVTKALSTEATTEATTAKTSHDYKEVEQEPYPERNKTPIVPFVDFETFLRRFSRHRGFKKPPKPIRERAAEQWSKVEITEEDLVVALEGYRLSDWGKVEGYPMLPFTKNPHAWGPVGAASIMPSFPPAVDLPPIVLEPAVRLDYPARWNELVPAKPVRWDGERGPWKALRDCEADPVFRKRFEEVCRMAQKIHEASAPEWLTFEFVIRRSEKGLGWWRVLNEFQGMAQPQVKSKSGQTQAERNGAMVARYRENLQKKIQEAAHVGQI